ncbi:MAG: 3-keto-L-gulonate-6-phosphate decarboxylase [Spirochaetaceae bacterium]|nr:MAG: 3-keto-L-gulonate-6-phosphate decarboxylase [Spirochaetaceae bacterium]
MNTTPELQLALDYVRLPSAIAMALRVQEYVDVIEIGTPLIKAAGIASVAAIREVCPHKRVLADMKTPDVGALEAAMAFDAGADIMTVIAGASIDTVREALAVARERSGKTVMVELTGVRDLDRIAPEWKTIGVTDLVFHREWDAEIHGKSWTDDLLREIRGLIEMGFNVTVTGGITPGIIPFFKSVPVTRFIAGRAIHATDDPVASARALREAIADVFGRP